MMTTFRVAALQHRAPAYCPTCPNGQYALHDGEDVENDTVMIFTSPADCLKKLIIYPFLAAYNICQKLRKSVTMCHSYKQRKSRPFLRHGAIVRRSVELCNPDKLFWNGARYDQCYYWWPIRSRIRAFDWCQNQRPWMTLKGYCALCFKTRASFWAHHGKFKWR